MNVGTAISLLVLIGFANAARFHSGVVSQACMQCICDQESGCRQSGCRMDVGSLSCGYFQIKQAYYTDCGSPGSDWKTCADDLDCASRCVQNYMRRYIGYSHCTSNCQSFARIHNGGPHGCSRGSTVDYWNTMTRRQHCTSSS
ncbi:hypothetical protein ScPMuIL_015239 [Solemya velum]